MGFSMSDFTSSVLKRGLKVIEDRGLEFKSKISKQIADGMGLATKGQDKEQQAKEEAEKGSKGEGQEIE